MPRVVLVTGARGYLGGRICRAISERSDLALIGAGRSDRLPEAWPGGHFVSLNPSADAAGIAQKLANVTTIIHLASPDQGWSNADPLGALDAITRGCAALLDAAIGIGVQRLIYVSTAHVYGTPLSGRIDERSVPRPVHPYAIAHRAAEDFVLSAHDAGRIDGIVLRLSNAIGAPVSTDVAQWRSVGNDLCRQAVTSGVLRLTSSGEQWRDFVTVEDVARAMLHFIDLPRARLDDGLFNLGGAMPLRILDIAERVADRTAALFGRRPAIARPRGNAAVEPVDYRIDKIAATGFRPRGDLTDEIDATLRLGARSFAPPTLPINGQRSG